MGCRRVASPEELVRVAAGPGGSLVIGRNHPGRGAWLCAGSPGCLEAAARRRAFDRALRSSVGTDAVEALRTSLSERGRIES